MKKFKSFIIAEVGVNHNGNIEIAKKLINLAKKADCEFVKFQSFDANELVTKDALKANYQKKNCLNDSQFNMLRELELPIKSFKELSMHCKDLGINFLSAL